MKVKRDMLQIRNLTKVYDGGVQALHDVTFDVPKGQFLAVIGLSGSGKSTLLRCINRLIEPTDGQILWNGENITAATPEEMRRIRRKIGMVFQHFNLVHRSPVLTNVLAGRLGYVNPVWSLLNRFPKEDIKKAMRQLERVGIADKAQYRADELSGGDEPVASLDPVLAHSIMKHLEEINKNDGVTVLCSLHFLDLVHRYADRVVALNEGKLVFEGLPQDIDDKKFKEIYGRDAERVG